MANLEDEARKQSEIERFGLTEVFGQITSPVIRFYNPIKIRVGAPFVGGPNPLEITGYRTHLSFEFTPKDDKKSRRVEFAGAAPIEDGNWINLGMFPHNHLIIGDALYLERMGNGLSLLDRTYIQSYDPLIGEMEFGPL